MKSNVKAMASLLNLDLSPDLPETQGLITEMESHLQSRAARHRALCRAGCFEQIDLAVYLKEVARLLNSPPRSPQSGGWFKGSEGSIAWRQWTPVAGEPATTTDDLESVIASLRPTLLEGVRRAVYACVVLAPPWLFSWQNPPTNDAWGLDPGAVSLKVNFAGGIAVELGIADEGPALPREFGPEAQRRLGADLAATLDLLVQGCLGGAIEPGIRIDVHFVASRTRGSRASPLAAA